MFLKGICHYFKQIIATIKVKEKYSSLPYSIIALPTFSDRHLTAPYWNIFVILLERHALPHSDGSSLVNVGRIGQ